MSYPCDSCGERAVGLTLGGYKCRECGATWEFIAPSNREGQA